jgi:hypothetical protein
MQSPFAAGVEPASWPWAPDSMEFDSLEKSYFYQCVIQRDLAEEFSMAAPLKLPTPKFLWLRTVAWRDARGLLTLSAHVEATYQSPC